jgi:hypothetical protein
MVSSPRRSTSHCMCSCKGQDRCNHLYRVSIPKHTQKPMVSSPRRSTSHCMRSCWGRTDATNYTGLEFQFFLIMHSYRNATDTRMFVAILQIRA